MEVAADPPTARALISSGALTWAGGWRGASRFWPLVAECRAVVVIPTIGVAGEDVAGVVATLHLVVGYTVLGVIVARKEG